MMIISTPNKKSIISLFNDQLKGFHMCYYYHFFILYSFASFVWQALLSNQLTNVGAIFIRGKTDCVLQNSGASGIRSKLLV